MMAGHENLVAKFMDHATISSLAVVAAKEEITRLREALATAETENSRLLADLTLERVKSADAIAANSDALRMFSYNDGDVIQCGAYRPSKNQYFTTAGERGTIGNPEGHFSSLIWHNRSASEPFKSQPKPPGDTNATIADKLRQLANSIRHAFGDDIHKFKSFEDSLAVLAAAIGRLEATEGYRDVRDRMDDMEDTVTKLAGRIGAIKANDETAS